MKVPDEKCIYYHYSQLNDILSHQTDEEQCAQKMIVFFLVYFSIGCFQCADFIACDCIQYKWNTNPFCGLHFFS